MTFKIIATLVLAVFAGWAYRDGGSSHGIGRWVRQAGMMIAMFLALWIWFPSAEWYWRLLSSALCWAESTYFKKKGADARWWNWALVGLVFALIPLPVVWSTGKHWPWFFASGTCLVLIVPAWCTFISDVQWEEGGRGAVQVLRFLLLLF